MIEKERIEAIKKGTDLVGLIQSRGIPLKKNGKGYVGLCPFHEDTNPSLSVNTSTNLWQCFGCGKAGDVISFVELFDKVDFKEAVKLLSAVGAQPSAKQNDQRPTINEQQITTKDLKLLARVVAYYQHTFTQDSRGINYLKNERGIVDNQS